MARWDVFEEEQPGLRTVLLRCWHEPCSRVWQRAERTGPVPRYCSDACKQRNHRLTRPMSKTARARHLRAQKARHEEWTTWGAQAWRQDQEEQRRWEDDWWQRSAGAAWSGGEDARATVFRLADLPDDGTVPLTRAFRAASKRCHPDLGGDAADLDALVKARELLERAGTWT